MPMRPQTVIQKQGDGFTPAVDQLLLQPLIPNEFPVFIQTILAACIMGSSLSKRFDIERFGLGIGGTGNHQVKPAAPGNNDIEIIDYLVLSNLDLGNMDGGIVIWTGADAVVPGDHSTKAEAPLFVEPG